MPLYQRAADLSAVLAQMRREKLGWAGSNLKSCTFLTRCPLEAAAFCCHLMGNGGGDFGNGSRKNVVPAQQRVHLISS